MRVELITDIDAGDEIAFIEDLQFEASIFDATEDELATIDWIRVDKAQVTGSLIIIRGTHTHAEWTTTYTYRGADHVKVLVYED